MPKKNDDKKKKSRSSKKERQLTRKEFFEALTKASAPIAKPSDEGKKQTSE